ncbi:unnamed protein product, partial [Adineta steineri]
VPSLATSHTGVTGVSGIETTPAASRTSVDQHTPASGSGITAGQATPSGPNGPSSGSPLGPNGPSSGSPSGPNGSPSGSP